MNTMVYISYDTGRPRKDKAAYRVSYVGTPDPVVSLRQIGAVWNSVVNYRGVYATRRQARVAARRYLAA